MFLCPIYRWRKLILCGRNLRMFFSCSYHLLAYTNLHRPSVWTHWLIFSLKSFCHGFFSSQKFNVVQEFVNCLIFTREPLLNACCPCTPEQDDSLRSRKSSVHYHACTPSLVEHSSRPYLQCYLSSRCSPAFLIDSLQYLYPGVDAAI